MVYDTVLRRDLVRWRECGQRDVPNLSLVGPAGEAFWDTITGTQRETIIVFPDLSRTHPVPELSRYSTYSLPHYLICLVFFFSSHLVFCQCFSIVLGLFETPTSPQLHKLSHVFA